MPDLRKWFYENVTRIKATSEKETQELIARLKQLTPAELLRQRAETLDRLTPDQYQDIVKTVDAKTKRSGPPAPEEIAEDKRTWRDLWRERALLTRMTSLTVFMTIGLVALAMAAPLMWQMLLNRIEIVRPLSTATWPACHRLSHYTDGCVYVPAQNLNWAWVAYELAMPLDELFEANKHLPPQYIPAQSTLVIWRHRGRLEP